MYLFVFMYIYIIYAYTCVCVCLYIDTYIDRYLDRYLDRVYSPPARMECVVGCKIPRKENSPMFDFLFGLSLMSYNTHTKEQSAERETLPAPRR